MSTTQGSREATHEWVRSHANNSTYVHSLVDDVFDLHDALAEIHEAQCGCDSPGDYDRCVAQPVSSFKVLDRA